MFKALKRPSQWRWAWGLVAATIQGLTWGLPQAAAAAERIIVSYGILERSIAIEDIQAFVETGNLSPQLREYSRILGLNRQQLATVSEILTTPADFDVVAVAQFLYTPQGKLLLKQVSEVIQTSTRQAGFSAARAALILAAADADQGLTLLNVLQQYPGEVIRVDIARGLDLAQDVNRAILQAEQAIDAVRSLSAAAAAVDPLSDDGFDQALNLLQSTRPYRVVTQNLRVPELSQPVALYLPESPSVEVLSPRNQPLIVISHGLGSNRHTYRYLAEYLAQAGFVVAAIEHTGSNDQQLFALQEGLVDVVVNDVEFARRPLEVTYTLDAIAEANRNGPLRGLIDLRQIGLIGQSFGGYTALAVAGATFSPAAYNQLCPPEPPVLNLSLLLQCQAPLPDGGISPPVDPRIDAVFVMNPIGSALFGPVGYSQITQPLMIVSGAADTVAPAYPEQILPFTWLTGGDRYLLLLNAATHFSVVGTTGSEPIPVPPAIIGPQPALAQDYVEIFALAFFQRYLFEDERFQPLLSAAFAERISREPMPLSLVQTLSPSQLIVNQPNPSFESGPSTKRPKRLDR